MDENYISDSDGMKSEESGSIPRYAATEPEPSEEYRRFAEAVRTIFSVPKNDVDKEMRKWKTGRGSVDSRPN
jgi:hypothetical protein